MKAALVLVAAVAIGGAALVAVLGVDAPYTRRTDPETDNAFVDGDRRPLGARVPGYIRRVPVDDNQVVHRGDLVAEVEPDDYQAARDQAAAEVSAAEAAIAALRDKRRVAEQGVEQARSAVEGVSADLVRTAPELQRQRTLQPTDVGVRRSVETAEADQRRTVATLAQRKAELEAAWRQLDVLDAQTAQAEAQLAGRQAALRLAEIDLRWTRVDAPVDGTLGVRAVHPGSLAATGTEVDSIVPLDTVWVTANFTERQITGIRPGQAAEVRVEAFRTTPIRGRVLGLSPATGAQFSPVPPDNTTGNFTKVVQRVPVKIGLDLPGSGLEGKLRPGMSATARVLTGAVAGGGAPP